jgi:PAS domain S-box-containing protein
LNANHPDVLDKRKAERAAIPERREALLATIVENTDDAIISKDLNGIILTWNRAAERMFGYSPTEIIGQSIRLLIPEELQYEEVAILTRIRAGQRIDHYETVRIRRNGETLDVSITISPLIDSQGRIFGASKIARDITERKRLEQQLIQSEKLAATGRMAATVAHEINNPLDAVLNLLYLARTTESLHAARPYIIQAEKELERVAHIARQTLGYYRDDGTPAAVVLQDLVENVLAVYEGKLTSADITTDCRFEDTPSLIASRGELLQVFSNVAANAIDAMPEGGLLRIRSKGCLNPDGVEVDFSDNGVGIQQEHLDKVFEPFFTTKGSLGTGIGLWIVKQLIEKRGGKVTITSSTQQTVRGTTVSIFLPLTSPIETRSDAVN